AASGPYGLVAILGVAYWKLSQKKDRQMQELFDRVAELSAAQTTAITKMEAALVALKEAISDLRRS
ncbi:MAG: hypothetical protein P1P87_17725, partial [Trueperaceae bacterium]|nr:hypothetical protein [Trueperaceae bacterium]